MSATAKVKPANHVSRAKVVVVVVAMAVVHAPMVKHATQGAKAVSPSWALWTAKTLTVRQSRKHMHLLATAVQLLHRATRMVNHARSAAVTAMAVNVAHAASAKNVLTCASPPSQSPHQQTLVMPLR
jgi:hypothetical protein